MRVRALVLSVLALLALSGCSIIEKEFPPVWRSHFRPKVGDGKGVILLSFDDRCFGGWTAALPIFDKYRAHATFFVSGPIDKSAISTMQLLCAKGHSVGLHGLSHRNADKAVADMGEELYWKDEIEPQLNICRMLNMPVSSFAYPNCRRTDATDALFYSKGFKYVRGSTGLAPYDPKGLKQAGRRPLSTCDGAFIPSSAIVSNRLLRTTILGANYHTDTNDLVRCIERAHERDEALVLTSHDIAEKPSGIGLPLSWLELILSKSEELGMAVVGYDELPDPI